MTKKGKKKVVLRHESESFDAQSLDTSISEISTRIGSPREDLLTLDGFTVRIHGQYIVGLPELFIEISPRNSYFWECKALSPPPALSLEAPSFEGQD